MKITEEDVILSYQPLILQECKNSYKGLEPEDRISEGTLAIIYAIRTYKIQYGCFKDYAVHQIRRVMKQQNTKAWTEKKPNSGVSLDAPLRNNAGSEEFTLGACIGQDGIDDTVLDVKHFIYSLSNQEQRVILMRLDGHSLQSVSTALAISLYSINRILNTIKAKFLSYYGK